MTTATPPDGADGFVSFPMCPPANETNPRRWIFTELGPHDEPGPVDWIDPQLPFLAVGMVTLLGGASKAGKTTLVRAIIRRVLDDGGAVLVVSEEPRSFWRRAFGEDAPGLLLPTERGLCQSEAAWAVLTDEIAQEVQTRQGSGRPIRLVVIDTIAGVSPIRDENSSTEVTRAMNAIRPIADAGTAVLAVHHTRKPGVGGETDGQPGAAFRGSSAFQASVDILAVLTAWTPADPQGDRRRRINCVGRLPESNGSWGVEVWPEELRYEAFDAAEVSHDAIGGRVLVMLESAHPRELTVKEIHAAVNKDTPTGVGEAKVRRLLKGLELAGRIDQNEPNPKKGQPERYSFRSHMDSQGTKRIEPPDEDDEADLMDFLAPTVS